MLSKTDCTSIKNILRYIRKYDVTHLPGFEFASSERGNLSWTRQNQYRCILDLKSICKRYLTPGYCSVQLYKELSDYRLRTSVNEKTILPQKRRLAGNVVFL